VRLFLAINLPADVRHEVIDATAPLRETAPDLSWVDESKLHLTLKFLGDVAPDAPARLVEAAERAASRSAPLAMSVREIGAFPNFRRARVVWIGVEQEPRLELLHHDLEMECEQLGFEVEGRPFRPHITLARVRAPLPVERMRALARVARSVRTSATIPVHRITLFESTLAPSGSRYRRLHSAILRGS